LILAGIDNFAVSRNGFEDKSCPFSVDMSSNANSAHLIKGIDAVGKIIGGSTKEDEVEIKAITGVEMLPGSQRRLNDKGMGRRRKILSALRTAFFSLEKERVYTAAAQQATLAVLPLKGTDHPF
jgi:hypothetical protein